MLGSLTLYFNSNRGRRSQSGSSVSHWHYQLFPYPTEAPSPLLVMTATLLRDEGLLVVGRIAGWPANHLFVEGGTEGIDAAALLLWRWLQPIHARSSAYNIEAVALPGGRFRAFLFPRHPAPDAAVPGAGMLSADFGGWECSGDIVIPTRGSSTGSAGIGKPSAHGNGSASRRAMSRTRPSAATARGELRLPFRRVPCFAPVSAYDRSKRLTPVFREGHPDDTTEARRHGERSCVDASAFLAVGRVPPPGASTPKNAA
jgi:hypothetical protein